MQVIGIHKQRDWFKDVGIPNPYKQKKKKKHKLPRMSKRKLIGKFAKRLQENIPKAESWFIVEWRQAYPHWELINNKRMGNYIVDFVDKNLKIIIEIDEPYHNTPKQKQKDVIRDEHFKKLGYSLYRIPAYNYTVLDFVINKLKDLYTVPKQKIIVRKKGSANSTPR